MTVPANGIERLIHFVDARIAQLNLSKEEVARRGGPNPDTLAKIRARTTSRTPNVETLLRLDQSLGWQPGSAAVTLLGGRPLSITAIGAGVGRPRQHNAEAPVTTNEILYRLAEHFNDAIVHLERIHADVGNRIEALRTLHGHFLAELAVDGDLVAEYQAAYKASTAKQRSARKTAVH
ncbi:MAG: hypothetical protein M3Y83_08720 [Actinomycetota bacterium]|jgi:hypothetical protein|nr:hypothetical protein [Actinomycetota bacterium]